MESQNRCIVGLFGTLGMLVVGASCASGESADEDESAWLPHDAPVRTGYYGEERIEYAVVDGEAIFEGDIVLGSVAELDASYGVVIPGSNRRWPNKVVPYQIDSGLANQARVTDAIAHWESNTELAFVLRTSANASQFPDYVTFRTSTGCSSSIGRRGGQQFINLATGCSKGNTIHEIGHAVGIWHEQSREDRDDHVTIVWENIQAGTEHNFDQHISDGDDIGGYDFGSIMHYGRTAFSSNGEPTIVTNNGESIGQRTALSAGDIATFEAIYP